MNGMRAGDLRHRVTIRSRSGSRGAYGSATTTWVEYHSCRAAIRALRAREVQSDSQRQSEVTHEVTIRYKAGVVPAMRMTFSDSGTTRYFDIRGVRVDAQIHRIMMLDCAELDSDQQEAG